jgi:hypothetical protein
MGSGGGEEDCGLSNPNQTNDHANSEGRTILWLWLLAAVMALALLFGIVKWIEQRERLNQVKPVPSYFFQGPDL